MLDTKKPLPIDATTDILAALNERGLCTDIHEGGTRFLSGSHLYHNGQESFNSSETSGFECITLNGIAADTAVLYGYRTIHRAQPFHRRKYRRIAFFSQMSPSFMPKGEPVSVLVDELYRLEENQRNFLGFNSQFPTAPNRPLDGKANKRHSIV